MERKSKIDKRHDVYNGGKRIQKKTKDKIKGKGKCKDKNKTKRERRDKTKNVKKKLNKPIQA